jgi:DNA repair exonuclease SbcCD ATPase subunit
MASIGHNNPPSPIEDLKERAGLIRASLNQAMKEAPVIQTQEDGEKYANAIKAGKSMAKEIEDKRKAADKPFNDAKAANKAAHDAIAKPVNDLVKVASDKLSDWLIAEEARRQKELALLRQQEKEAEEAAAKLIAEAEEAIEDSNQGVVEDLDEKITAANEAYDAQQAQARATATAARNVRPILKGSIAGGRGLSLRTKKEIVVDDPYAALRDMAKHGADLSKVKEVIASCARAFKSEHKRLPNGVSETEERSI